MLPFSFLLTALLGGTLAPGGPRIEAPATAAELEKLQRELLELDAEIADYETRAAVPVRTEISERAETLRSEATYLRVKSRKHREAGGPGTGLTSAEVIELRRSVAILRDDLSLSAPSEVDASSVEVILDADTVFAARLLDSVSSETAEVGDRIEAKTVIPLTVRERVLVPRGATVFGVVELVDRAGRTDHRARVVLAFDRLDIEGRTHTITATAVGASKDLETGWGDDAKKLGVGAGVGGVLGAVLGGGTAAIAGAILGGSGILFGTEGRDVELPEGTMLQIRLDRPLRLNTR